MKLVGLLKRGFERVLLLLLSDDLLQRGCLRNLVGFLLLLELQDQRLIDALQGR